MATAYFDILAALGDVSKKAADAPHSPDVRDNVREVEDLVALLNFQLRRIDRHCELWSESVHEGAVAFDWSASREFAELYRDWLGTAEKIARLAKENGVNQPLQGGDEFWQNLHRVRLMSLDTDRSQRSIDSLQQGKGVPFERAIDQLRDALR